MKRLKKEITEILERVYAGSDMRDEHLHELEHDLHEAVDKYLQSVTKGLRRELVKVDESSTFNNLRELLKAIINESVTDQHKVDESTKQVP